MILESWSECENRSGQFQIQSEDLPFGFESWFLAMIDPTRIVNLAMALQPGQGVFLEAGANDGLRQSNTLELEKKLGWRGILIEPSPFAFAELKQNRPENLLVNCALVAHAANGQIVRGTFLDGHLTGTMDDSLMNRSQDIPKTKLAAIKIRMAKMFRVSIRPTLVSVPAASLDAVFRKYEVDRIDFMSLDVEGLEIQVLKGIDFSRIAPTVIVLETRKSDIWEVVELLTRAGYCLVENLSNFSTSGSPTWTQDHEDYLFILKKELGKNPRLLGI